MDNKTATKKLFLKPASFQSAKNDQNGTTNENGSAPSPLVNNPFLKCEKDEPEVTKQEEKNSEPEKDPASNLFKPAKTNLFQQTGSTLSENSNFVFGQNLHERVVMENVNSTPASDDTAKDAPLFSSALIAKASPDKDKSNDENASEEEKHSQSTESSENTEQKTESLVEAARKYEEIRSASKRKYEEVEVTTGEEDEKNIMEISNCKLFCFIENNYEERGRGILRLNDSKTSSQSRVVFRSSGSLRLLLNTKVWRDQICEQPSQKSLRLTAIDATGGVKIYLVMGRVDDMSQLYQYLSARIRREKERTPEEVKEDAAESEAVEPAKKRPASE